MARQSDLSDWGKSFKKPKDPQEHPVIDWIKKNLVQFLVFAGIWFIALPLILVTGESVPSESGPTKIVLKGGPRKVYEPGEANKVSSIVVPIRNIGQHPALGIEVNVDAAGRNFPLQGPTDLKAGGVAEYSAEINLFIPEKGTVVPHLSCYNCR